MRKLSRRRRCGVTIWAVDAILWLDLAAFFSRESPALTPACLLLGTIAVLFAWVLIINPEQR